MEDLPNLSKMVKKLLSLSGSFKKLGVQKLEPNRGSPGKTSGIQFGPGKEEG